MNQVWIVISRQCESCGGQVAVTSFSTKPTEEQVQNNKRISGGGTCTETIILCTEVDGDAEVFDPQGEVL